MTTVTRYATEYILSLISHLRDNELDFLNERLENRKQQTRLDSEEKLRAMCCDPLQIQQPSTLLLTVATHPGTYFCPHCGEIMAYLENKCYKCPDCKTAVVF